MIYYLVLAKSYPHHLKTDYIRIYHNLYGVDKYDIICKSHWLYSVLIYLYFF